MIKISAKHLRSFREMSIGLIGTKKPQAVYFKTRWGIHTFFMRFDIDVIILDKKNRVKALKQNLKPFKLYVWNPLYGAILELPPGTIKSRDIKKNETIKLELNE